MKLDEQDYAQMGKAAVAGGIQRAIEILQAELNRLRGEVDALQPAPAQKRPAPAEKKRSPRGRGSANYWAKMTAEERSAEMKRRVARAGRAAKQQKPTTRMEQFVETMRSAGKRSWDNMSKAKRKARIEAMNAGRERARRRRAREARQQAANGLAPLELTT